MIKKPFALSLSQCEYDSISSPRTVSFYCAVPSYPSKSAVLLYFVQTSSILESLC